MTTFCHFESGFGNGQRVAAAPVAGRVHPQSLSAEHFDDVGRSLRSDLRIRIKRHARPETSVEDFSNGVFRKAIAILTDGDSQRARRILDLFSDDTTDMPQSAEGMKGALGAPLPTVESGAAATEGGAA